jgi:hypothetical protein
MRQPYIQPLAAIEAIANDAVQEDNGPACAAALKGLIAGDATLREKYASQVISRCRQKESARLLRAIAKDPSFGSSDRNEAYETLWYSGFRGFGWTSSGTVAANLTRNPVECEHAGVATTILRSRAPERAAEIAASCLHHPIRYFVVHLLFDMAGLPAHISDPHIRRILGGKFQEANMIAEAISGQVREGNKDKFMKFVPDLILAYRNEPDRYFYHGIIGALSVLTGIPSEKEFFDSSTPEGKTARLAALAEWAEKNRKAVEQ